MSVQDKPPLKAIDFFCGAGGMSFGLYSAGFKVLAGIDNDPDCKRTYEANIPGAKFIKHDISTLTAPDLERRLKIHTGDPSLVFAGCSPCQFWSKIRTDKTKAAKTAFLLEQFQKFISHFRPGFVVVENVPGLHNRGQSPLLGFTEFLKKENYVWDDGIVNANHYGVPQNRTRYLLLATRLTQEITLPKGDSEKRLKVADVIGEENGFCRIEAGHRDVTDFQHSACKLTLLNLRRIRLSGTPGGDRTAWKDDPELQIPAYDGRDDIFRDVYARMYWDRPAPTITTRFNSFSNGRFGHPEEDRAISIREGATLQSFPKNYIFHGTNQNHLARQIGNAVPPELARRIGQHLTLIASNG